MRIPFFGSKESEMAKDPICGMEVHKANPPGGTARYQNKTYFFCGAACRHQFEEDPSKYATAGR